MWSPFYLISMFFLHKQLFFDISISINKITNIPEIASKLWGFPSHQSSSSSISKYLPTTMDSTYSICQEFVPFFPLLRHREVHHFTICVTSKSVPVLPKQNPNCSAQSSVPCDFIFNPEWFPSTKKIKWMPLGI